MEQVFAHVLESTYNCFQFAYNLFTSIHIVGNVSIFDLLIAFFVCGLIPVLVATSFGGRGMAIGAKSTINEKKSGGPKYNKSYKTLKGARK